MAWIESHEELPTHPKTRKLARKLGVSVPTVIGHLHVLWYWCLTHRPDGVLEGMDADDVADAAGWDDDGEPFVKALLLAGWIDDDGGQLVIHDWWDGAGKTIKRRKYATSRQRRARESQDNDALVTDESPDSHDDVTRDTQTGNGADSDSDSDKDLNPPPGGNQDRFPTRLANELKAEHGWQPPQGVNLHQSFQALLREALERLPAERHRNTTMGLIRGFAEKASVQLTNEAVSHTARLVSTHPADAVLSAWNEAIQWGAGIGGEYVDDPLALSKYAAKVLTGKRAA